MKLLILLFLFISPVVTEPDITFVRGLFKQAVDDQEKTTELIDYLNTSKSTPVFLGYMGAATMLLAKHS